LLRIRSLRSLPQPARKPSPPFQLRLRHSGRAGYRLVAAMRAPTWRVFSLLALALSSGLILGCGTTNTGTSGEAGGASTSTALDGSSPTEATDGSQSVPAVNEMGVFSRPGVESDVLPKEFAFRLEPTPCTEWHRSHFGCQGEAVADRSRLLLSGVGSRASDLYAWPTTNGWVCFAWEAGGGGGGCTPHFETSRASLVGVDPDGPGGGAPGSLVGLIPDDVVAVDITLRGTSHPATLGKNSLFYELPDGDCTVTAIDSLTITYRDGTSDTRPLEWGGGSLGPCDA
jgi:hypothetical protein